MDIQEYLKKEMRLIATEHNAKLDIVMSQLQVIAPFFGMTAHEAFVTLESEKVKRQFGLDAFNVVNRRKK